ncbi:hypothetical protein [Zavarzinella formosa]|uniref:hypothetical protein n=1 Tax=Zavarzinella formosa TaxID=360055 RepID=UPI0003656512|nr:hypothetical protein [Zavarzinella formosa]
MNPSDPNAPPAKPKRTLGNSSLQIMFSYSALRNAIQKKFNTTDEQMAAAGFDMTDASDREERAKYPDAYMIEHLTL